MVKTLNLVMFLLGCRNWTHVPVNATATEYARIHVNSRSRNKIRPVKKLPGPVLTGPKCASLGAEKKAGQLFHRHGSNFVQTRVNTRTVQRLAWNLVMFLPGCLANVKTTKQK